MARSQKLHKKNKVNKQMKKGLRGGEEEKFCLSDVLICISAKRFITCLLVSLQCYISVSESFIAQHSVHLQSQSLPALTTPQILPFFSLNKDFTSCETTPDSLLSVCYCTKKEKLYLKINHNPPLLHLSRTCPSDLDLFDLHWCRSFVFSTVSAVSPVSLRDELLTSATKKKSTPQVCLWLFFSEILIS